MPSTGEIVAEELTTACVTDAEVCPHLLHQIDESISSVSIDGAYDQALCYQALQEKQAQVNISSRKNAKLSEQDKNLSRDQNSRAIRQVGRKQWKQDVGYHRRSLTETARYRMKQLFGSQLACRSLRHPITEARIRCKACNIMTQLGMPHSVLR